MSINLLFYYRTIKWKNSIDENARFFDGSMLPCILIENKVDLLTEQQIKDDSDLKEFAQKNKFIGSFRSSAKLGININESMEYLIQNVVTKMEEKSKDGEIVLEKDRKSIILGSANNKPATKSKDNCC